MTDDATLSLWPAGALRGAIGHQAAIEAAVANLPRLADVPQFTRPADGLFHFHEPGP
jgi:hypothetical protein